MTDSDRDYYCSYKFRYLKVDLQSQTTYTCHAAQPHKVDFDWLQSNRGNLFNHDINVKEREMMLVNQRAPSCEQNCWYAEDRGQISPRLYQKGYHRTHETMIAQPEIIDLTVGGDCNLTCSYCCKEYSSAWRRELVEHGDYDLSPQAKTRYQINAQDRLLMKINQPELMLSPRYQLLLQEIQQIASSVRHMDVTGGEPFLNNRLVDLLTTLDLPSDSVIHLYSGLGVDPTRFHRMIDRLRMNHRIKIMVSAENIYGFLQFNRYGIAWNQFEQNIQTLRESGMDFSFHCTLSNLTAFGFVEFYNYFHDREKTLTFVYQPRMQALHVLDPASKRQLMHDYTTLPEGLYDQLTKTMAAEPNETERRDLSTFLITFVKRRPDLDLAIYPKTFLDWLNI